MSFAETFDAVVIGSGSGGGVVAARLAEDEGRRVLLLEAGPDFPKEPPLQPLFTVSGERSWFPSGIPEFDWWLYNEPQPNGHRVRLPRGRLVGGSSMVNSTLAVRPKPSDLDAWAAGGATGWDSASMDPVLRMVENDLDFPDDPNHGHSGPLKIRRYPRHQWAPINEAFVQAGVELGFRESADLNAPDGHAGVIGAWPHNRYREERLGTLTTYLREARRRAGLTIRGGALVDRVLLRGSRAVGVRYLAGGEVHEVGAELVVVAGGVYGSPPILQRSGIGRPDVLGPLGIPVVADLPVGERLRDHPACGFRMRVPPLASLHGRLISTVMRGMPNAAGEPEYSIHPMPIDEEAGDATLFVFITRSDASGTVRIVSADPEAAPRIDQRYLTGTDDRRRFAEAWELCRSIVATRPFRAAGAVATGPGSDEALERGLVTAHHQSGGCRMGPADGTTVVDPGLRVHGIDGLLVADASVFPETILHNTNLMAFAVGEQAAINIRRAEAFESSPG